jgi:hypothetical protein
MTKKRLELLPEVLPAPVRQPASNRPSPRERTLKNLTRLVAAAALTTGGCKDNGSDPGYGVVDPMPPPARCGGLADSITATAKWTSPDEVFVTLSKPAMVGSKLDASVTPKNLAGVTVKLWMVHGDGRGELTLGLVKDGSHRSVTVGATCPNGPQPLIVQLQTPVGPATTDAGPGGPVGVQLHDGPDY